jgi:hypothetical protein
MQSGWTSSAPKMRLTARRDQVSPRNDTLVGDGWRRRSLHDSQRLILREDRQCESDFYRGVRHQEVPLCSRERRMREVEVGSQFVGAIHF